MDFLTGTIPWLTRLQDLETFEPFAKFFTQLGEETFFLAVLPLVYWCISARTGAHLGLLVLANASLNSIVKVLAGWPRPGWLEAGRPLRILASEPTFGLPSGHAQGAAAFWPFLALAVPRGLRPFAVALALVLAVLIGISRLFLAVHFPQDVLAGWALGILFLAVFSMSAPALQSWYLRQNLGAQVLAAALLSATILFLFFLANASGNARLAGQGFLFTQDPLAREAGWKSISSHTGALFGLLVGLALARRQEILCRRAAWPVGLVRYLTGMVGVLVLWRGLGALFPFGTAAPDLMFRFVRYTLISGWIAWGAPWLFVRWKVTAGHRLRRNP